MAEIAFLLSGIVVMLCSLSILRQLRNRREVLVRRMPVADLHMVRTYLPRFPRKEKAAHVYFLILQGDENASNRFLLAKEISTVLDLAHEGDRVVMRLESGGGNSTEYEDCVAQLLRLRDHNIPLTVCIHEAAASGGYQLAVLGEKVLATPFAEIGSIGVILRMCNLGPLFKRLGAEIVHVVAGEKKFPNSHFLEITEETRKAAEQDVQEAYVKFKKHVKKYRPQVDVDLVATGECWCGDEALERKLIDGFSTCEDELRRLHKEGYEILSVRCQNRQSATMESHFFTILFQEIQYCVQKILYRIRI